MQIPVLNRTVLAANLPLEKLASSTQIPEGEKVKEVSRQFEAVLLRQILSQAQKPLFQNTLFPGGGASQAIYQDLITQQLAERISHGGSFGFAKVLEQQLDGQISNKEKAPAGPNSNEASAVPSQKKSEPRPQPGKRI